MSRCVIFFGAAVIGGIIFLARFIYQKNWFDMLKKSITFCFSDETSEHAIDRIISRSGEVCPQFMEKRNEFWLFFGQIVIAVIIAVIITVLLLEEKIDKAAGVSLLSALGGFTIAKGVNFNPRGEKS